MTLGPATLALGWMDRVRVAEDNPVRVFGRVPMFYYVPYFYLVHGLAVLFAELRYGRCDFLLNLPGMVSTPAFPKSYGYNLAEVYAIWLGIMAALYFHAVGTCGSRSGAGRRG